MNLCFWHGFHLAKKFRFCDLRRPFETDGDPVARAFRQSVGSDRLKLDQVVQVTDQRLPWLFDFVEMRRALGEFRERDVIYI